MSKQIKQMEMDALRKTFAEVRDMVLVSISGFDATAENQMRLSLRKKNIRLHRVKNSLASRVFQDVGLGDLKAHLEGPTTVVWGSDSIAQLSKELDVWVKKSDKIKPKIAVADGALVTFDAAKKFPTREEALSGIISRALSPASRLVGQLRGPGGRIAGQVKTLKEKPEAEPAPAAA